MSNSDSQPRRVVVYSGADPRLSHNSLFYLHLFWAVIMQGRELGYEMIPIIDTRPEKRRIGPPQEFLKAQEQGEIHGYVAIMIYESMVTWIKESGAPYALLGSGQKDRALVFKYHEIVERSIERAAELGCKTMGLLMPSDFAGANVLDMVDQRSEELGVTIKYEWIIASREAMEVRGYRQFESLWDLSSRPQALMIFPDVTARGVVSAIVERRIKVPEELKLILHRNVEAPYTVPFPCDWFEISVEPLAAALMRILQRQWDGLDAPLEPVHFNLVKVL